MSGREIKPWALALHGAFLIACARGGGGGGELADAGSVVLDLDVGVSVEDGGGMEEFFADASEAIMDYGDTDFAEADWDEFSPDDKGEVEEDARFDAMDESSPKPPPPARITVDGIPDYMNGTMPYTQKGGPPKEFRLRVPTGGFTIELLQEGPWEGRAVLLASEALTIGGKKYEAGTDLFDILGCSKAKEDPMLDPHIQGLFARCEVPEGALSPSPVVTFTAYFVSGDMAGEPQSISVEVSEMPPYLDPFPTPDVWLCVLSRDLFEHEVVAGPEGTYEVLSMPGPNGIPDFDEALKILGLLSENKAFSEAARAMFIERIRKYADEIFGLEGGKPTPFGVPLYLYFEGDTEAPDPSKWSKDAGFSMIALGGDPDLEDIASGIVGRAWIDWNNQEDEDNTVPNFGVFVTNIVRQVLHNPLGAMILHEISPVDGTPLGEYPLDEAFLDPQFDPESVPDERLRQRYAIFQTIMEFGTLAVAVTLCHEMGHSLGLVPSGPPPEGLFGGMDGLSFTKSDPGYAHIDTPGLNVMQTGKVTSYFEVLEGRPRFNELNLAYLRRRLVVGPLERPLRSKAGPPTFASCGLKF